MKKLIFRWETALFAMLVAELLHLRSRQSGFLNLTNLIYAHVRLRPDRHVALPLTLVHHCRRHRRSFASVIGLTAIIFVSRQFSACRFPFHLARAGHRRGLRLLNPRSSTVKDTAARRHAQQPLSLPGHGDGRFRSRRRGRYEGIGKLSGGLQRLRLCRIPRGCRHLWRSSSHSRSCSSSFLHFTRFGRTVFLSGQSERLPVSSVYRRALPAITYVITGVSAAIAGLVMSPISAPRVDLGSATLLPP